MAARFPMPEGGTLRITSVSGHVTVVAEDRPDLELASDKHRPELRDEARTVVLNTIASPLEVRCPRGTNVVAGAVSGHIRLQGSFGAVRAATVSGHITVDSASGDVDLRSISGHLSIGTCGGQCQLNTKSGRISAGETARAVRASTLSGQVELGTAGLEEVQVRTVSGTVRITVQGGRMPRARLRTLSGQVRCDCPEGTDFDLKASTVSGSIEVSSR